MTIHLNVPEDIAKRLAAHGGDPNRLALEALALEGYRSRALSEEQVRRLLGLDSRFDVHAFLKKHGVPLNYSLEDLKHDIDASSPFPNAA
jgi:predicted HTH domain antitoxin